LTTKEQFDDDIDDGPLMAEPRRLVLVDDN
jgi:hypothetical protein